MNKKEKESGAKQAAAAAATSQESEISDLASAVRELTQALRERGASRNRVTPAAQAAAQTFRGIQSVLRGKEQPSQSAGATKSTP